MLGSFAYADNEIKLMYDPGDATALAGVEEIAQRDVYGLRRFANQAAAFVDIGANLGVATLIMAKLNPASTIYAFEPNKQTFELLSRNIELNRLSNVEAFNLAVTKNGVASLQLAVLSDLTGASSTYANPTALAAYWKKAVTLHEVECISLDQIITKYAVSQVHLLKMDCEGAEFDIIYGSELFKTGIVRNLVAEFHNLKYGTRMHGTRELIDYCSSYISGCVDVVVLRL